MGFSIPEGYSFIKAYMISFANNYSIDWRLIGRSITIRVREDYYLSIRFPILDKDHFPDLRIPELNWKLGIELGQWGRVSSYSNQKNISLMRFWVSAILVECFSNKSNDDGPSTIDMQRKANRLLHALHIINPDAIECPSDIQPFSLCDVKYSVSFIENKRPQIEVHVDAFISDHKGYLNLSELCMGIRNIDREISLQYEMLDNARINLFNHDARASVLNCASAIEVLMKRKVESYLDSLDVPSDLKDYVLGQADNYSKLRGVCNKFSLSLKGLDNVKELVMDLRNRVIHGGFTPSIEDARNAYECTREALRVSNTPVYEQ